MTEVAQIDPNMHRSNCSILTLIFLIGKVSAYGNTANFDQCYNFIVGLPDPVAYNIQHDNDTFRDATELYLSLNGCHELCGQGYQLWQLEDTIDRVSLWVIPALILLTHFSFAPLDIFNFAAVIIHAIGDPIDSIWSLLTRIEVNRRLLRRAKNIKSQYPDLSTDAEGIAVICAAYEEHGIQTAIGDFESALRERANQAPRDMASSEQSLPSSVQHQLISPDELFHISEASHELLKSRRISRVLTLIPIISLALSLASAINRTIHQIMQTNTRLDNETAHSIAVLSLFFIFIPIVAFSGVLGSFSTVTGAVEIIQKLRWDLNKQLFPELEMTISEWSRKARFSGMNSTYRSCKTIPVEPMDSPKRWCPDRSRGLLLFYSLVFVLCGACVPAIFLSATNHADERKVAVGCRTLTWLSITGLWISSLALDAFHIANPKWKWRYTIIKDTVILTFVIIGITFIQIGFYNSCSCRSSFSGYINLNPYTDTEWYQARVRWGTIAPAFFVFNALLIAGILCVGGNPIWLLCQSRDGMLKDAEELEKARMQSMEDVKVLEGTRVESMGGD